MQNKYYKVLILTLIMFASSSCKANMDMASELTQADLEQEFMLNNNESSKQSYPISDIKDVENFVKYYLYSKYDIYESKSIDSLANNYIMLSKLHPENYEIQERAFILALANSDFESAKDIMEKNDLSVKFEIGSMFEFSEYIKKHNYDMSYSVLDYIVRNQNRIPLLKILEEFFEYRYHKDITKLEKNIFDIKSSISFEGFKYYYMAREYEKLGNIDKAFDYYSKALFEHELKSPDTFLRWAYIAKSKTDDATAKLFKDALKTGTRFGDGFIAIDDTPIDLSKIGEIDNSLDSISAHVFYDLAWLVNDKPTEIIKLALLAISNNIKDNYYISQDLYAKTLIVGEKFGDAEKRLQNVSIESPFYMDSLLMLSYVYEKQNKTEEAIKILKNLDSRYVNLKLITLYLQVNQNEEALSLINDALKQKPTAALYFYKGIVYSNLKDVDKSIKALKTSIELDPNNSTSLNYLGYILIDSDKNIDEGIDLIKKAIKLNPTNPAIIDSLGWAYMKLERYQEGLEQLERAFMLNNSDSVITGHLADAYYKNGRKQEAITYWKRAIKLNNGTPEDMKRIQKAFEKALKDN